MKHMKSVKTVIDVIMSSVLLFLMAFQVTGDKYHEWLGVGMLVLFLFHNFLNIGWYKALFKGKYSVLRVLRMVVNLFVLVAILVTCYSGIVMSRYVFELFPLHGGMATARKLHLAGSYWSFVFMSVHLGMHWSMIIGKYIKGKLDKTILIWILRLLAIILAVAGAYFFAKADVFRNMFLQNEFAVLDYETVGGLIILQNLVMMSMWVFVGHYFTTGVAKLTVSLKKEDSGNIQGVMCIGTANVSWREAVLYCNARSEMEGLTEAYIINGEPDSDGFTVSWNRGADGYRLPTEAEWEYACRAGTTTPFNTENSISAEEANYYGHYPYEIEGNYFEQENLTTKPGQYRETTVDVDSFSPNAWGLYNMHGNVSEWVWDYYGSYDTNQTKNPSGPLTGNLKVYRGGGWNDFAKNMRSAYRATLEEDMGSFNIGIRLVRNAYSGADDIIGADEASENNHSRKDYGKILIAYFSWGGNTRGVAEEIQAQTGANIFEITLVEPYSSDYNTVLDQAQHDQNIQARPEIANQVENMEEYNTILLGYPNWWASIPMPIASFLEAYDFSGKTIIPFCSHGGGRFGQSLTAIAKLAPDSTMGEGLSIHYSGGNSLSSDVKEWLQINGITD